MSSTAALRQAVTGQAPKTLFDHMQRPEFAKAIGAVAGKFLTADRMLRLCINAVKKTPQLLQCDPQTVLGAMMTSAALGLEPNTVQQQAFLIPYKRRAKQGDTWVDVYECQFQIGARGFVTLAYRSPRIEMLQAECIHQGDHFKHRLGSTSFLEFEKALVERGEPIGAFSYVKLKEGGEMACVLPLEELEKIRARSETYRALVAQVERAEKPADRQRAEAKLAETPWVMWFDDMAAKSAIKKHAKQLPIAAGDALLAAAEIDSHGETASLDLRAMADVDTVRAVVGEGIDAPALEHDPAPLVGEGAPVAPAVTVVHTGPAPAPAEPPAAAPPPRQPAQRRRSAAPPAEAGPTYAQLAEKIQERCVNRDDALMELDQARHLPADQQAELKALIDRSFPE